MGAQICSPMFGTVVRNFDFHCTAQVWPYHHLHFMFLCQWEEMDPTGKLEAGDVACKHHIYLSFGIYHSWLSTFDAVDDCVYEEIPTFLFEDVELLVFALQYADS